MPSFSPSNIDLASSHAHRLEAVEVFNVLTGPELVLRIACRGVPEVLRPYTECSERVKGIEPVEIF